MEKKITKKQLKKIEKKELNHKYKTWSNDVKTRDNHMCIVCGSNILINAHHIIPREIKELRYVVDNGISLCPKHHKFGNYISPHKNPFWFYHFLWLKRPEQLKRLVELYIETFKSNTETYMF
jgi:hypothetical protein